jgi:hypothetical protein
MTARPLGVRSDESRANFSPSTNPPFSTSFLVTRLRDSRNRASATKDSQIAASLGTLMPARRRLTATSCLQAKLVTVNAFSISSLLPSHLRDSFNRYHLTRFLITNKSSTRFPDTLFLCKLCRFVDSRSSGFVRFGSICFPVNHSVIYATRAAGVFSLT